jgi:hypothetical protein
VTAYREARWGTWRWRASGPIGSAPRFTAKPRTIGRLVLLPSGRLELAPAMKLTDADVERLVEIEAMLDLLDPLGVYP